MIRYNIYLLCHFIKKQPKQKIQETEKHSDSSGRFGDLVKVVQEIERHLGLPESFSGDDDVEDDDGGNYGDDEDDEDYLKFTGNYGILWSL